MGIQKPKSSDHKKQIAKLTKPAKGHSGVKVMGGPADVARNRDGKKLTMEEIIDRMPGKKRRHES
jgi:hypothetical protein